MAWVAGVRQALPTVPSWLTALLSSNSHNSGNFHPNDKNKIPKSKLGSPLSSTKNISEIKQRLLFHC